MRKTLTEALELLERYEDRLYVWVRSSQGCNRSMKITYSVAFEWVKAVCTDPKEDGLVPMWVGDDLFLGLPPA